MPDPSASADGAAEEGAGVARCHAPVVSPAPFVTTQPKSVWNVSLNAVVALNAEMVENVVAGAALGEFIVSDVVVCALT